MKEIKKVIFDCDNTMGIQGCDVDDGLALLYLLGEGSTEICGITTTYGNNTLDTVYTNTLQMLEEIGQGQIPVLKGCPNSAMPNSEAVDFLVKTVNTHPGEISILATGSLTNLYGAHLMDPDFFAKLKEIVLMGGITQELRINGKLLRELNFSCDPKATERVLISGENLAIITGNHCLDAYFSGEEFVQNLESSHRAAARYILDKCHYWFEDMMAKFKMDGFYNWDVVAAVYLVKPELFQDEHIVVSPNAEDLKQGWLLNKPDADHMKIINTPRIKDSNGFKREVYQAWLKAEIHGGK